MNAELRELPLKFEMSSEYEDLKPVVLEGKRLILRNIDWESDFKALCRWNSNPEVLSYIEEDNVPPRTEDETRRLYEHHDRNGLLLIAELKGNGPIGEAFLNRERVPEENAYRAPIMIGEPALWGQGLGTDILRTLLDYCFITLCHNSFYAFSVNSTNLRAIRMYTRCGFIPIEQVIKEGSLKNISYTNLSLKLDRKRYIALREYFYELPY